MTRTVVYEVEVMFGDCDPAGIVYFANFCKWMDASSLNYFVRCGVPPWRDTAAKGGIIGTPLVNATATFKNSATYGEDVVIETWVEEWRTKSFVMRHVARRGDASPSAAISVSNSSPDIYTEGLDANIAGAPAGFVASGTIANLAAGGTDAGSLHVALNTGTAGSFGGSAQVNFMSTGSGTTGAADISVGSSLVNLAGKVYETAVTQVNTLLVDFGMAETAAAIDRGLLAREIVVRPMRGYGLPQCLRITVGRVEQNARLLKALDAVVAEAGLAAPRAVSEASTPGAGASA